MTDSLGGQAPVPAGLYPPDVFAAACPTRRVLDRVGDKWAVLILILLARGTKRFNALRRLIDGVSQKMLSQTLKSLERDGLVSRRVIPSVPVTVEYSITPLGMTLHEAVDPLRVWAETHIGAVEAAQQRYDTGTRDGSGLA
ncbi:MAG: helix-turn-helix domain-containing protein [Phreatobacter sp.]|nr:helix-turn-helix domain-containing protein [Phreatobacter sp.]